MVVRSRHLLWFPGSPSTGAVPPPLAEAAAALGLGVLSWPRPGYPGRARVVGRTVADAAADAAAALDAAGAGGADGAGGAVAVGYSGGGPHALAAAALLGSRVTGVLVLASPAPWSPQPWWTDGMASPQALRAAARGRAARERHAETEEFDPSQFTDTDWAALAGPWGAVGDDAQAASASAPERADGSPGVPDGLVDDDLALVSPWGADLAALTDLGVPVLLAHGTHDRVVPPAHGEALAAALPRARLERVDGAGHVAVLLRVPDLLEQLVRG